MIDPARDWDWFQIHTHCLREARKHTANHADAEDVAQDAVLRAWRRRDSLKDPDAIWLWLARITHNEAMRLYERSRPEIRADLPERAHDSYVCEHVAMRLDVRSALGRLSTADQYLAALRYGRDLTCGSAAGALDMPVSTAKVRLHRLRSRLARSLASTYGQ